MHLSCEADPADMLQFVSGQLVQTAVHSVYYQPGVLLFRLDDTERKAQMSSVLWAAEESRAAHLYPSNVGQIGRGWFRVTRSHTSGARCQQHGFDRSGAQVYPQNEVRHDCWLC